MLLNLNFCASDGEKYRIRNTTASDMSVLMEVMGDPAVNEWIYTLPFPFEEKEAKAWINRAIAGFKVQSELLCTVASIDDDKYLGSVNFHRTDLVFNSGNQGEVEIGFWLGKDSQGRGLIKQAAAACIDTAMSFLGGSRLIATASSKNEKSIAIIKGLGLKYQGTISVSHPNTHKATLRELFSSEWKNMHVTDQS